MSDQSPFDSLEILQPEVAEPAPDEVPVTADFPVQALQHALVVAAEPTASPSLRLAYTDRFQSPRSLRELAEDARQGDRPALEELIKQTYRSSYTLAYRLTASVEAAEDVTQNAYLKIYLGIGKFRGEAEITSWIYRIVTSAAKDYWGKRGRRKAESLTPPIYFEAPAEENPELTAAMLKKSADIDIGQSVVDELFRGFVEKLLGQLPYRTRAAVVLRDIYDLSHAQVADHLGISEAAAKVRVHRGRRRLHELLNEEENSETREGILLALRRKVF